MTELEAMLRRRRHMNGEMTPEKRDMRRELLEWRESKAMRASRAVTCLTPTRGTTRSNENTPYSIPRSSNKVADENQAPWMHTASPPLTPAKRRGHVNAISPLMEVCLNAGKSSSEARRPSGFASPRSPLQDQAPAAALQRSKSGDEVQAEIAAWEECAQAPCVPPSSPLTPLNHLLGRREAHEHRVLQGFLRNFPSSVHVLFPDEASPERRRLLTCLEESEEVLEDHQEEIPSSPDSLFEEELRPESVLLHTVQNHEVVWPAQTILDMEDFLSRAYDIEVFWFFEARDRASSRVADQRMPAAPLETIEEYPPDWPQWQIESVRSRSAMRERRRSTSQRRGRNSEATLVCSLPP